ncbi:MAG: diguanylate cyclase domain-containing protein [Pleomorphochaeta sp.]
MKKEFTNLFDIAINEFNYILDVNLSKKKIVQVFSHIPQIYKTITYETFMTTFGSNVPFVDKEKAFAFIRHIKNSIETKDYSTQVVELRFENYINKTKFDWSTIKCIYEEKDDELHVYIISKDITVEKENEIKVIRSSQRDPLSGLINRFGFSLLSNQALLEANSHNTKLAFFFLDIDNFKNVNDAFGHRVGDKVILEVSDILRNIFGKSDIVCRYGGDEFVAVLTNFTDESIINIKAEEICRTIENIKLPSKTVPISCSIGISIYPVNSIDIIELINLADTALYYAKSLGKNCFYLFDETNNSMRLSNDLNKIKNNLLTQNQLLELILNETEKGVMITDAATYEIIYVNNAFRDLFKFSLDFRIIGKKCFEVLYDHNGPCINCSFKRQVFDCNRIEYKGEIIRHKTRMIEWDNQTAYINFFNIFN